GGFIIFASGRGVIGEFRRRKIYSDVAHLEAQAIVEAEMADAAVDEPTLEVAAAQGGMRGDSGM
ncbi:MAG: hypothetical protein ACR2P0_20025, partial [Acidimicrobiales bacterium]